MGGRIASSVGALIILALATPAARAMDQGWFFEIAMGQANFTDVKTSDLDVIATTFFDVEGDLEVVSLDSTLSNKDRSYAVVSGYKFNRHLTMETGYFRLGAFQYATAGTVRDGGGTYPATFALSFRAKGVWFGVAAMQPLGEIFEVRGRVGLSTSNTRIKLAARVLGSGPDAKFSASSQDFYIGAGVGVKLWDYYRIGVDWMRHRNMGKPSLTYRADVDNIMLSIGYQY